MTGMHDQEIHSMVMTTIPRKAPSSSNLLMVAFIGEGVGDSLLMYPNDHPGTVDALADAATDMLEDGLDTATVYIIDETWPHQHNNDTTEKVVAVLRTNGITVNGVLGARTWKQGSRVTDADGNVHGVIGPVEETPDLGLDNTVDHATIRAAIRMAEQDNRDVLDLDRERNPSAVEGTMRRHYLEWLALLENVHYGVVTVREAVENVDNLHILARSLTIPALRDVSLVATKTDMATTAQKLWLECARRLHGTSRANAMSAYAIGQVVHGTLENARFALDVAQQVSPGHTLSALLLEVFDRDPGDSTRAVEVMLKAVERQYGDPGGM